MADSLKDIVTELEEFLKEKTKESSDAVYAIEAAEKTDPVGKIKVASKNENVLSIKKSMATNPLQQAGADLLTKMGTTVTQQLVKEAFKKINLSPVQNATQNFFQAWASVTTLGTEVAMELARNSAKDVVKYTNKKDKVILDLKKELKALHNACAYLINGSPFIDAYIKDLIQALSLLKSADKNFSTVAGALNRGTQSKYLSSTFDAGLKSLEDAQELILPDRGVDVSSIRSVGDYISTTITKTAKQTKAAVLIIPGISLNIGKLLIEYVKAVTELNLALLTYSDALAAWIDSYKATDTIYIAMLAHIQSGRAQLVPLISQMDSMLYPVQPSPIDPTSLTYAGKVSAAATGWGMRNQAIIEWMKLNPGKKAAKSLETTSKSVAAYIKSKTLLDGYGDISYSGGVFKCSKSAETADTATVVISRLLLKVNTLVAKRQTSYNITLEFRNVEKYFDTSLAHSARIRSAINPFLSTTNTLPGPARKLLGDALGTAKKYGLDKVAALVIAGRTRDLALLTAEKATTAGAAIHAINKLIEVAKTQSTTTDAQIERLENARSLLEAERAAKDIEANRSYENNADAARESDEQRLAQIKGIIGPGIEVAKSLDKENGQTSNTKAETAMSSVIPGFNNNNALSGV